MEKPLIYFARCSACPEMDSQSIEMRSTLSYLLGLQALIILFFFNMPKIVSALHSLTLSDLLKYL